MIELTKKYKTRDGRDVRVLCVDGPDKTYPVVAVIQEGEGSNRWDSDDYTADGLICKSNGPGSPSDLIEVKPERTGWINVYSDHYGAEPMATRVYANKEKADEMASSLNNTRIACVQITYREGDGL